ncbi:MAG: AI-2E family transporter [Oscillospiraceae bacterium]|nr:AI-2E family transporter [Oscillospiraceae bacterium]
MDIQKRRDFLTNVAYWAVIFGAGYLVFEYLVPISVPVILGVLIAYLVVRISRKVHCTHRLFRLGLGILIYCLIGLGVALLAVKGVSVISGIIQWLPKLYERKILPLAVLCYEWSVASLEQLDPTVLSALEMLKDSLLSALKNLISWLSAFAVDLVSGVAVGVPDLILRLLAMIFSTVFVAGDYDRIRAFAVENIPLNIKKILKKIWVYLTDTLFVVIRSYALIMLLTFTELSILFSLFGIEHAVVKAGLIAMLDILPILGTGGIMIPWAIISLVLGYTELGIQLFIIYGIVTVVRNYVEPKIVGTQLGLHPIITLVSMFIGLRLFGFWGLFGLPVGISFLWKQKQETEI